LKGKPSGVIWIGAWLFMNQNYGAAAVFYGFFPMIRDLLRISTVMFLEE
jgi:hypothetical protein